MSIFVNGSTDPDIRQFWMASTSPSSCRSVHTVLQMLTFGSFELHHYHHHHHHVDMCTQFYRFWHPVGSSLRCDVHICKPFYGSWHSAILSCINIISCLLRSTSSHYVTSSCDSTVSCALGFFHPRTSLRKLTSFHKLTLRHKFTRLHILIISSNVQVSPICDTYTFYEW